jgi:hypothetical protein
MAFALTELAFQAGLFANRSRRASKGRWIDGSFVRFRDGLPEQVGGWQRISVVGDPVTGRARDMLAWRPNSQIGRFGIIGTNTGAFLFDGGSVHDVSPDGFVAGRQDSQIGDGFGMGVYGQGDYGTARPNPFNVLDAASWTFDMFGEVLIGCTTIDGSIYEFTANTDAALKPIDDAPKASAICVSDERHVFAFGCDGNPNLVRWSDRENRAAWAPTPTNRAGSYDMQATSPFQCGRRVSGFVAAWTMTEAFAFAPLSNSLVYSYDRVGTNCGVMGPHAVAVVNDPSGDAAYWMAPHGFYVYDTSVRQLACDLHDYVFKDINLIQRVKVQARSVAAFGEIWFFYCSAASSEIDRAVIYSYQTGTWSKAELSRLAWLDAGVFPNPIAIDADGVLYQHEMGDLGDGRPIPSFVTSSPIMSGVGQQFTNFADFWPDLEEMSGTCAISLICRDFPGAPDDVLGPFQFDQSTEKVDLHVSTRQAQIRISGVSGHWELGLPLINMQQGGGL